MCLSTNGGFSGRDYSAARRHAGGMDASGEVLAEVQQSAAGHPGLVGLFYQAMGLPAFKQVPCFGVFLQQILKL